MRSDRKLRETFGHTSGSVFGRPAEFRFGPPECGFEWRPFSNGELAPEPASSFDGDATDYLLVMKANESRWGPGYWIDDPRVEGLYLKFGALEPTPEMILNFADQFGPLGVATHWIGESASETPAKWIGGPSRTTPIYAWASHPGLLGESLAEWKGRIAEMRVALDLIGSATSERHVGDLEQWIEITENDIEIKHPAMSPRTIPRWSTGETEYPNASRRVVQWIANKVLKETTSLGFKEQTRGDEPFEPEYRTETLLGALWIQFLDQSIAGSIQRCKECSTLFPIGGASGKRITAESCSPNCALRHHRAIGKPLSKKTPKKSRKQKGDKHGTKTRKR